MTPWSLASRGPGPAWVCAVQGGQGRRALWDPFRGVVEDGAWDTLVLAQCHTGKRRSEQSLAAAGGRSVWPREQRSGRCVLLCLGR